MVCGKSGHGCRSCSPALSALALLSARAGVCLEEPVWAPIQEEKKVKKNDYESSVTGCEPLLLASCGALGLCRASGLPLQGRTSAAAVGFEPLTHCQG